MKTCTKCEVEKNVSEFRIRYGKPISRCKECASAKIKLWLIANKEKNQANKRQWKLSNPEVVRASAKKYREAHPEKCAAVSTAWLQAHPEKAAEYTRKYDAKNRDLRAEKGRRRRVESPQSNRVAVRRWQQANTAKVRAGAARRRAVEVRATPAWRNDFFIEEIYDLAARRTKCTGIQWHVDHIVPLRSPLVSGLHVEHNLRVIPAVENIAKGNRHWPGMP